MPPIINFKICDNSADCNGIAQCPTGVFTWDDDAKTIRIDHTKCVECGACADFCSVNAIRYAGNAEELAKIQAEIDADPRTVAELLVDRYGCAPIIDTHSFELSKQKLADRMNTARPVLIEFNTEATIECLLKSVPIAEIQAAFHPDAVYSKFILGEGGGASLTMESPKPHACGSIRAANSSAATTAMSRWTKKENSSKRLQPSPKTYKLGEVVTHATVVKLAYTQH